MFFKSPNEALLAYENGAVTLHARIKVRVTKTLPDGRTMTGIVDTTVGRILFNEIIPQDLGFVDRTIPGNELKPGDRFPRKEETVKADPRESHQYTRSDPDSDHSGRYQGDRLQVLYKSRYDRIHFRYDCPGNQETAPCGR